MYIIIDENEKARPTLYEDFEELKEGVLEELETILDNFIAKRDYEEIGDKTKLMAIIEDCDNVRQIDEALLESDCITIAEIKAVY